MTASEKIRQLIDQLIDRDALVNPQKFQQINQQLRSLFQASNMLIIRAESSQAQLSFGTDYHSLNRSIYNLECLQASHFFRAAKAARVQLVRYLISTITAFSKPVLKRVCSNQHQSKFN